MVTAAPQLAVRPADDALLKAGNATAVFIFYHGTFAPAHAGHCKTAVAAANYFHNRTRNGAPRPYHVVGVYWSPSHAAYCRRKLGESRNVSLEHRLSILSLALAEATRLSPDVPMLLDTDECDARSEVPFPGMLTNFEARARRLAQDRGWQHVSVLRLAGGDTLGDVGRLVELSSTLGFAAVVSPARNIPPADRLTHPRVFYIDAQAIGSYSSTNIRQVAQQGGEVALKEAVGVNAIAQYVLERSLWGAGFDEAFALGGGVSQNPSEDYSAMSAAVMRACAYEYDDFVYEEIIGEGCHGRAQEARHKGTGMVCVAKQLKNPTEASIKNQLAEIRRCASIVHPNIVRFLGYTRSTNDHPDPLLLLEKADKVLGHDRVVSQIPESRIRPILRGCASGLAALHSQNILHCDLHISNIFTNGESVVIGDLGNSRVLDPGQPPPALHEYFWGHPTERKATLKTDMYSLGLVLVQMLARQRVYQRADSDTWRATMTIAGARAQGHPDLQELLTRLLAEDPKARPSAIQVVDLLDGRLGSTQAPRQLTQIGEEQVFNHLKGGTHTGTQTRLVWFPRRFDRVPQVQVALACIDTDKEMNTRLKVTVKDVTCYGFALTVNTWCDSIVYNAKVTWVASESAELAMGRKEFYGDACAALLNGSGDRKVQQSIRFKTPLPRVPQVWLALSTLDIDCKAHMRIRVKAIDVTRDGFTLEASTWEDSSTYGIAVAWGASADQQVLTGDVGTFWPQPAINKDHGYTSDAIPQLSDASCMRTALRDLDIDGGHNARIKTWIQKQNGQHVIKAHAWADTTVYGAQVSWIALRNSPAG